jgi:hypothetical protein
MCLCTSSLGYRIGGLVFFLSLGGLACAAETAPAAHYFELPTPKKIDWPSQPWEGDQQPHTLSVIEFNREGFRYWGWYGLNQGRGMGLARSHDLIHWTKFEGNPILTNARWPSVVRHLDAQHHQTLYFAVTRDYDTPMSHIVLATSVDGKHLAEVKNLVSPVSNQRNQNPNLYEDPPTHQFILTFYRGNDRDYFDIVSKSATSVEALDQAPERVLMHTSETVAAPTLLYVPHAGPAGEPLYYLATEIFPHRYDKTNEGEWQVRIYSSTHAEGPFAQVAGNPVQVGGRACLFQHIFNGKYYGYQSRLDPKTDQWDMEVLEAPLPR